MLHKGPIRAHLAGVAFPKTLHFEPKKVRGIPALRFCSPRFVFDAPSCHEYRTEPPITKLAGSERQIGEHRSPLVRFT
jgi:hypothetical protein